MISEIQRPLKPLSSRFAALIPCSTAKNRGADYCLTEQALKLKICLTVSAQLPIVAPRCPPSGQAAKQYGEVSEWLKEHAWKVCIRQRIGGSNPPLTAIFKMRARTKVRAFFFWIAPGDSNLETPCALYAWWRCAYQAYGYCRSGKRSATRQHARTKNKARFPGP